jgi:hypothetical protein
MSQGFTTKTHRVLKGLMAEKSNFSFVVVNLNNNSHKNHGLKIEETRRINQGMKTGKRNLKISSTR